MKEWLAEARRKATDQLDRPINAEEWNEAVPKALDKLARIISREGDADGARMEGGYFGMLVAEEIIARKYTMYTIEATIASLQPTI